MDEPAHGALVFHLDGQDVPIAAHGDELVLQILALSPCQIFLQPCTDTLVEEPDLAADRKQFVAGVILQFVLPHDLRRDVLLEGMIEDEIFGEFPEPHDALVRKGMHGVKARARRTQQRRRR